MIIGLSGKKQHGKDTVCAIIQMLVIKYWSPDYYNGLLKDRTLGDFISNGYYKHINVDMSSGWDRKQFAYKLKQIVSLLIGCKVEQLEDNKFKETLLGEEWSTWLIPQLETMFPKLFALTENIEWISAGRFYSRRDLTPRMLLQLIGTQCGRGILHPNIWINALTADYIGIQDKPKEGVIRHGRGYMKYPKLHGRGEPETFLPEDRPECFDMRYPNWIITDVRFPNEVEAIKKVGGIIIRVNRRGMLDTDKHESETALDDYDNFDGTIENNSDIDGLVDQLSIMLKHFKIVEQ